MLFFLFFALSMAQGPPCLLADSGELDPFLYIQSSIQLHNGDLLKLKPVWRIAPAANTLCSNYPGVDCDNTCHVSSFIMNFMWDNGTDVPSWDMGPAQRGPTSVNFWKLTFAFQLLLDIGRNSTGEVPGKQDIPVFADLPVTLVMFAIFSRSNEQVPSQVTIPDDSLKNILVPSATYQGLFIVHLSGIQQGGGTLFSPLCIGVPGVRLILLNSTTIQDLCFYNPSSASVTIAAVNVLQLSAGYSAHHPSGYFELSGTPVDELPAGFATVCPMGQYTALVRDNHICRIGQPLSADIQLHLNETTVSFASDYGYNSPDSGQGANFTSGACKTIIERDNQQCISCIDGSEVAESDPVPVVDVCGICNGDGNSCRDCAGVPFGTNEYDQCNVCHGSNSCVDCAGVPFGTSVYDQCFACNGQNTCLDCSGVPFGTLRYDSCDVCNGYDLCLDCRASGLDEMMSSVDRCGFCYGPDLCVPCEENRKDVCGVCLGDGSSCHDCAGVLFGPHVRDACDVCNGDNSTCSDCAGIVDGTLTYDVCEICGGDGQSCLGCDGLPFGDDYDICGVCGGTNACADCEGTIGGLAIYDVCDVCDGDGKSCRDCAGVPFGNSGYNRCGQCTNDTMVDCDPDELEDEVRERSIVFDIVTGVIAAALLCLCIGCCLWAIPPERRRLRKATSQKIVGAFLLATTAQSHAFSAAVFRSEMCAHTNIESLEPLICDMTSNLCSHFAATVQCHEGTNVISFFSVVGLTGEITPSAWEGLRGAEIIEISSAADSPVLISSLADSDNAFASFFSLERLRLFNIVIGAESPIPISLKNAVHLRSLELLDIPEFVGDFGQNDVFCSFPSLQLIRVRGTGLTGSPVCNLYKIAWNFVDTFDFRHNKLDGQLPDMADLARTVTIQVDGNRLTGALDTSKLPLVDLRTMTAGFNLLDTISADWTVASQLQTFVAAGNLFAGPVPLFNFINLRVFDISFNRFSGMIDPSAARGPTDEPYEIFRVNDNLLEEPWPDFHARDFCGPCQFEHNSICDTPSPPPSPTPALCGACAEDTILTDCTEQGLCQSGLCKLNGIQCSQIACGDDFTVCDCDSCVCVGIVNSEQRNTLTPCLPFSTHPHTVYDEFDAAQCTYSFEPIICAGGCGDRSCIGCDSQVNSSRVRDACGICNGDGTACEDCCGRPRGPLEDDRCGVCFGDGNSCLDCRGVPFGSLHYDLCGVCGGDNSRCSDCLGVPFGPAVYDFCGVCEGRNVSCTDCKGVLFGTSRFDENGNCNGNGPTNTTDDLTRDLSENSIGELTTWFVFAILALIFACTMLACGFTYLYRTCTRKLRDD